MQDIKRLKVGAVCGNTSSGVIAINLVEYDGGDFSLVPKKFDGGLVLVDPQRPAGYGLQIMGEPEQLTQLANALLSVARGSKKDDTTDA